MILIWALNVLLFYYMTTRKIVSEQQISDPIFGDLKQHISNKDRILWSFPFPILNSNVLIYMDGNSQELNPKLKSLFLYLKDNEQSLRKRIIEALDEFIKIDINTFDDRFTIKDLSIWTENYDITILDTIKRKYYVINFKNLIVQDIYIE